MSLSYLIRSGSRNEIAIIAKKLTDILKVPVTQTALTQSLEEHPDYPSLLSLCDVLNNYGIANIAITTAADKIADLPVPFVVPLKAGAAGGETPVLVMGVHNDVLELYFPANGGRDKMHRSDFEQRWPSGIVLLVNAGQAMGEKNYAAHRREEIRQYFARAASWLALPVVGILAGMLALVNGGFSALWPVVFLLLTLAGCVAGALLLWYELDQYNPLLQQICSAGKKVNCGAVLHSKAAKIGGISWSNIGFTYFTGGLLLLLVTGITDAPALFIVGWLNVLAVPYIFFSVYYQWRVARQWCVLCLCVQAILVLQLATALAAGWHTAVPLTTVFLSSLPVAALVAYLLPFIMVSLLLPAWRTAKESRKNKNALQRLKHNQQIFDALALRQKSIPGSMEGLGITLGNPHARHKLVKVCNPYCGPCASAHRPVEELLENNPDIQLQIIFTATNEEGDKRASPVKHLLAIAEKQDEQLTRQALDDWYMADHKDYEVFSAKYPMNGELKKQDDKVEAMWQWCTKTDISATPTFFVNGYQLPDMYSIHDLKYFLSV